MKVTIATESSITPAEIARILFNAEPEQFREVFLQLYVLTSKSSYENEVESKLRAFAKAMAPELGGGCRSFWHRFYRLIVHYEMLEKELKTS